jgi:hypothetical protein
MGQRKTPLVGRELLALLQSGSQGLNFAGWNQAIAIFSRARALFTASERSLRS